MNELACQNFAAWSQRQNFRLPPKAPKLHRELVALRLVFLLISPSFSFFEYPIPIRKMAQAARRMVHSSAVHGAKFDTKFSQTLR
jgi:hypothetical protein